MDIINISPHCRFLVTGVAGFIGSNIAEALLDMGAIVVGIDNFSNGSMENIMDFLKNPNFQFIEGDICDYEFCSKVCNKIDYVLHQAAWGSVPKSIVDPISYNLNNISGFQNIIHAALTNNVKRFIYASSASVYGDNDDDVKTVGQEGRVLSPYALSKKVDEEIAAMYFQIYGMETIGLRYFNVFGQKQKYNSQYAAVIPKFAKALMRHQPITIYGDGTQRRDFTYVNNVVSANLKACVADSKACGKVFNVACGNSISVIELYQMMSKILKVDTDIIYKEKRKGDIDNSLADISQTELFLNYKPVYSFSEGLAKTIEWYNKEFSKIREV